MRPESIVKIKKVGNLPTIDIEINNQSHCFYGNGIATSNSHSASYGDRGYVTAYIKAHFPLQFYNSWLLYTKDKGDSQDRVDQLVEEAKLFNINVCVPDLRDKRDDFYITGNEIKFGLVNIKNVGDSSIKKLFKLISDKETKLDKPLSSFNWYEILTEILFETSSGVITSLIFSGAFSWLNMTRQRQNFELGILNQVFKTPKEVEWFEANRNKFPSVQDLLSAAGKHKNEGGAASTEKRLTEILSETKVYHNPPVSLEDEPFKIAAVERNLLGVPLTYTRIDSCSVNVKNASCKDFLSGRNGSIILAGEIKEVKFHKTKRGNTPGQKMAFLKFSDGTGTLDNVIVFPGAFASYESLLVEGNLVVLTGKRGKDDSFIADRLAQAI